jgi:DNA-binding MurR/RpiR family transcriptional regulator
MTSAPTTYDDLQTAITGKYDKLPGQLQKFGRFALEHPDTVAMETVTYVADKADVQPSTIVRFAKAFEFDGFSDLQRLFRARLMKDTSSYRDRIQNLQSEGREGIASILDEFSGTGMEALDQLRRNTPPAKLTQAIEILRDARDIHLLAQGRSYAVAQYLHYALSRLEIRCLLADGAGGMLRHQIARADPDDAVIAISFAPYTPAVVDLMSEVSDTGCKMIAITDSPLSPLVARSSVSFEIQNGSDQTFRTLVAPICLAQTLVVGLGQALSPTK